MLGTNVRSVRHLMRMADTPKEIIFSSNRLSGFYNGWALMGVFKGGTKSLIIVNEPYANRIVEGFDDVDETTLKHLQSIQKVSGIRTCIVVDCPNFDRHGYGDAFSQIIVLDDNFSEKLISFEDENKRALSSFDDDFKKSAAYKFLFSLTDGNKNIFLWAIRQVYKNNASLHLLKNIINICSSHPTIVSKLSKGSITAYGGSQLSMLMSELCSLRNEARKNSIASSFNTKQKKILKEKAFNPDEYEIINKFSKLSGKKKVNFIKKMSTIENADEIIKHMSQLVDIHFEWNKESFMRYLSQDAISCKVAYEKDDIVIVEAKDYETIKRLAKTTNWCISKNKTYWNQYVEDRPNAIQFVMFDFSKKEDSSLSIVGFTISDGFKITNAHDFQNRNLFYGFSPSQGVMDLLNSFAPKKVNNKEIYSILRSNGITLSDLIAIPDERYHWNKDSFMAFFEECIDEDDYIIVADQCDKMAIIVDGPGVSELFGKYYAARVGQGYQKCEHIIFADFSKPSTSHDKLVFGICEVNQQTGNVEVEHLYNDLCEIVKQTFDSKLEEFGLPYDIVCRDNDLYDRFLKAIVAYDFTLADSLIKFDTVRGKLNKKNDSGQLHLILHHSIHEFFSMDGIELFYRNGMRLGDVLRSQDFHNLVTSIITSLARFNIDGVKSSIPTASMIDAFEKRSINDRSTCIYIGFYLILMKMIEHEDHKTIYNNIATSIMNTRQNNELFDYLLIDCGEALKGDKKTFSYIMMYAKQNDRHDVVNSISSAKRS